MSTDRVGGLIVAGQAGPRARQLAFWTSMLRTAAITRVQLTSARAANLQRTTGHIACGPRPQTDCTFNNMHRTTPTPPATRSPFGAEGRNRAYCLWIMPPWHRTDRDISIRTNTSKGGFVHEREPASLTVEASPPLGEALCVQVGERHVYELCPHMQDHMQHTPR